MDVDVVIVNHDSGGVLRKCLDALYASELDSVRLGSVTVIDNASCDGSAAGLAANVIHNAYNVGFSKACNQGAFYGGAPYILFLNPDVLLDPCALESAVLRLASDPQAGILGIALTGRNGKITDSALVFPELSHLLLPRRLHSHFITPPSGYCDCVIGAFFLMRRTAYQQCRFDERFYLYYEEIDAARRLAQRGYKCLYAADITATHIGGVCAKKKRAFAAECNAKSRVLYAEKYLPPFSAGVARFLINCVEQPLRRLIRR